MGKDYYIGTCLPAKAQADGKKSLSNFCLKLKPETSWEEISYLGYMNSLFIYFDNHGVLASLHTPRPCHPPPATSIKQLCPPRLE